RGRFSLFTFLPDALQEDGRGFVVAPLLAGEFGFGGDEFAAEGAGEDCLRELINVRFRLAVTGFERVGGFEECFDATDDFLLFGIWRNRDGHLRKISYREVLYSCPASLFHYAILSERSFDDGEQIFLIKCKRSQPNDGDTLINAKSSLSLNRCGTAH